MSLASFFITSAYAQGAAPAPGGESGFLIMVVAMFAILYFFMIRPQMKRQKEMKQMIEALQKGDEVVIGGGILGRVTRLADNFLTVEIAPNTEVTVQKGAVQMVLPKGTIKSAQ